MQRTKSFKKADAIFGADFHLRDSTPTCRTDDFEAEQWKKLDFISALQKKHDCPVIHSGDLNQHWKPSPYLLTKTMEHIPNEFWTIMGNHDLPQHSLELMHKCGVNTLVEAGRIKLLSGTHWGQTPEQESLIIKGRKLLVYHVMTYQGKKPWPGCTDPLGATLLRKYPQWDCIISGHNHKPFTETHEGRLLVNPGSITRQEAGQADHKPRVYLYYADTNTVEAVYLPIKDGVVTREHIERDEERNDRIDAFVSKFDEDWEAELSFEGNLERFYQTNKIKPGVKEIITKSLEI
jgi:putative phosphoesterase